MKIMVMTVIMKMILNISSVKWGHMGNFEPNSIKTIFSTKILWSHLGHFEPDPNFHNYYNLNCELIP